MARSTGSIANDFIPSSMLICYISLYSVICSWHYTLLQSLYQEGKSNFFLTEEKLCTKAS
jgi:hypothetical protein